MKYTKAVVGALLMGMLITACQKDESEVAFQPEAVMNPDDTVVVIDSSNIVILDQEPMLPVTWYNYANVTLPAHLQTPPINGQDNTPADNPITDAGATLGRVLFYDKNLSFNNTIACASCHQAASGFSDPATLSMGFDGGETGRHSMGLVNARFYPNEAFFWDERAATLEDQVLMPIQDAVEMGMTLELLEAKLNQIDYYPELFTDAFGDATINSDRVSRALAQFVRAIVSYQSKYDDGRAQLAPNQNPVAVDFPNFTAQENDGKDLFFDAQRSNCAVCHGTETFTARVATNNGLDLVLTDNGLGDVTNNAADNGKFKVPSLRQIAERAPYMHDGRFATLEEVIDHYSTGIQAHPNLDPALRGPNGQPRRPNFSDAEKQALVAFLETLTDPTLEGDVRFSDPFMQ